MMAWVFDAMEAAQDVIQALDPAPDIVAIVPAGTEARSISAAKNYWVTLHPGPDSESSEPGAAYVVDYDIGVTVWIKSAGRSNTIVSTMATKTAAVRGALRYSSLNGYGRVQLADEGFGGGEYIDGEDAENVYGYQFTITVQKQYTS